MCTEGLCVAQFFFYYVEEMLCFVFYLLCGYFSSIRPPIHLFILVFCQRQSKLGTSCPGGQSQTDNNYQVVIAENMSASISVSDITNVPSRLVIARRGLKPGMKEPVSLRGLLQLRLSQRNQQKEIEWKGCPSHWPEIASERRR